MSTSLIPATKNTLPLLLQGDDEFPHQKFDVLAIVFGIWEPAGLQTTFRMVQN